MLTRSKWMYQDLEQTASDYHLYTCQSMDENVILLTLVNIRVMQEVLSGLLKHVGSLIILYKL